MKLTGENRSTRRETCLSATLSTINPTWTNLGSNPGLRGERPATNRLSHGKALINYCVNTDYSRVKFCVYNLRISRRRRVCNY
jgi:hypothetical protein